MTDLLSSVECRVRAYELRVEAASHPKSEVADRLLMMAEEYEAMAVATAKFERWAATSADAAPDRLRRF
jgi:hypothetical protein